MKKGKFMGWYFKHQKEGITIAFILGSSASGAFVQMLSPGGVRYFDVGDISVEGDRIRAGDCVFSPAGCVIRLPGISGEIAYGKPTPLASDIMGPFRFLPMTCRHGVISMSHSLRGDVTINDICYNFDGGRGYIEKDSGVSFPDSYQWLQCNTFAESRFGACSLMVSIARIPFFPLHFEGCICAVMFGEKEYRFATYRGVKILSADENHIILSQGKLRLEVEILSKDAGYSLKAPLSGRMTNTIRERANVSIHFKLWERRQLLLDLYSHYATYEYVAPAK